MHGFKCGLKETISGTRRGNQRLELKLLKMLPESQRKSGTEQITEPGLLKSQTGIESSVPPFPRRQNNVIYC